MLGPYWVPEREHLVTLIEKQSIFTALEQKFSVIIDATNFRPPVLPETANIYGCEWVVKDFTHVSLEECIARDAFRDKSEQVGEEVIRKFHDKYIKKHEIRENKVS